MIGRTTLCSSETLVHLIAEWGIERYILCPRAELNCPCSESKIYFNRLKLAN